MKITPVMSIPHPQQLMCSILYVLNLLRKHKYLFLFYITPPNWDALHYLKAFSQKTRNYLLYRVRHTLYNGSNYLSMLGLMLKRLITVGRELRQQHLSDLLSGAETSQSAARGTSPPENKSLRCCCRNSRPTVINPDYDMTKRLCLKSFIWNHQSP